MKWPDLLSLVKSFIASSLVYRTVLQYMHLKQTPDVITGQYIYHDRSIMRAERWSISNGAGAQKVQVELDGDCYVGVIVSINVAINLPLHSVVTIASVRLIRHLRHQQAALVWRVLRRCPDIVLLLPSEAIRWPFVTPATTTAKI